MSESRIQAVGLTDVFFGFGFDMLVEGALRLRNLQRELVLLFVPQAGLCRSLPGHLACFSLQ